MKLPPYVYVTCTQTFTRKSSARRHNSNLHSNQGIIVQMLEYIIGRSCGQILPSNQLFNRRSRRPSFIRNQKMNNLESGFNATLHDMCCGIKTRMLNRMDTQHFQNVNPSIEPSHRLSKITQNEPYDEFGCVSKMAEVQRLILDNYGPSAILDNLMDGIKIYTSDPDRIHVLDEFLAVLRKYLK